MHEAASPTPSAALRHSSVQAVSTNGCVAVDPRPFSLEAVAWKLLHRLLATIVLHELLIVTT